MAMKMTSAEFSQTSSQQEYNPKPNQNGNPRRIVSSSKPRPSGLIAGNGRYKSVLQNLLNQSVYSLINHIGQMSVLITLHDKKDKKS